MAGRQSSNGTFEVGVIQIPVSDPLGECGPTPPTLPKTLLQCPVCQGLGEGKTAAPSSILVLEVMSWHSQTSG